MRTTMFQSNTYSVGEAIETKEFTCYEAIIADLGTETTRAISGQEILAAFNPRAKQYSSLSEAIEAAKEEEALMRSEYELFLERSYDELRFACPIFETNGTNILSVHFNGTVFSFSELQVLNNNNWCSIS